MEVGQLSTQLVEVQMVAVAQNLCDSIHFLVVSLDEMIIKPLTWSQSNAHSRVRSIDREVEWVLLTLLLLLHLKVSFDASELAFQASLTSL